MPRVNNLRLFLASEAETPRSTPGKLETLALAFFKGRRSTLLLNCSFTVITLYIAYEINTYNT